MVEGVWRGRDLGERPGGLGCSNQKLGRRQGRFFERKPVQKLDVVL